MKYKRRRPLVRIGVLVGILVLLIVPITVAYFYIPSNIKIRVGEEHLFNFELPLKAQIVQDEKLKVKDILEETDIRDYFNLNRPFCLTMGEEGRADMTVSLFGILPIKTVGVEAIRCDELIPSGEIVGIKVNTDGILVLGVGEFESGLGQVSPCKGIVEKGDLIVECNHISLKTKEDLRTCIEKSESDILNLKLVRQGDEREVEVIPVHSNTEDANKIGLWIKDSTQGIGTVTYIDPKSGTFGALGHGIAEQSTGKIVPVKDGELMNATIVQIKKGEKGVPGEISGTIDYTNNNKIGDITQNNSLGIYGKVNKKKILEQPFAPMPIAFQDEINEGRATILASLTKEGVKEYEVEIQKVSKYSSEPSKSMVIKIVDEELLSITNGIIQGMSGSPIMQDGKLIGAVTHVFVNDPTRGYGIFIENMVDTAQ